MKPRAACRCPLSAASRGRPFFSYMDISDLKPLFPFLRLQRIPARLQRTRNPFSFLVHFSSFTLVYFFAFTYCFGVLLLFSYTFSFLCLQRIAARLQRTRYGFHFYLLVLWSGGGNYSVFSPRPPGFSELKLRLSVAEKNGGQRIKAAARAEHGPLSLVQI